MSVLDDIKKTSDIKTIKKELLPNLAQEIRQKIIETTSKTGGHIASSLGAVDLTVALHYVFDVVSIIFCLISCARLGNKSLFIVFISLGFVILSNIAISSS